MLGPDAVRRAWHLAAVILLGTAAVVTMREWFVPAWVYPLLPLTGVIDAVTNPLLLLLAPAVIVPGD